MTGFTTERRTGSIPAIALGVFCGLVLPVAAVFVALLTGFLAADLAAALNLGGDSDAFGEGADGFVVGAFIGFVACYLIGAIFTSVALQRAYNTHLIVLLTAIFSPAVIGLLLLAAAY